MVIDIKRWKEVVEVEESGQIVSRDEVCLQIR